MLAWVVIYRRHLQHSSPISSSLRTLRLCVQLSTSQRSNLPLCFPFLFTSLPPQFLTPRSPYPPAPIKDPDPVGTPSRLLATDALSPLAATFMDLPASVANKRLTSWLSSLDATLTKNRGVLWSFLVGRAYWCPAGTRMASFISVFAFLHESRSP